MEFLTRLCYLACGYVEQVRARPRGHEVLVGTQVFALRDSPAARVLSRGAYVRLLVRLADHENSEVLIVQIDRSDPEYVGPFLYWPALAIGVLFAGIGFAAGDPIFCGVGLALAGMYVWFLARRLSDFQQFAALYLKSQQVRHAEPTGELVVTLPNHLTLQRRLLTLERMEFAHDALIAWDLRSGRILYWSAGASRLYGYSMSEALTKDTHHLLQSTWEQECEDIRRALRVDGTWVGVAARRCADGGEVDVHARLTIFAKDDAPTVVLEINWVACRDDVRPGRLA